MRFDIPCERFGLHVEMLEITVCILPKAEHAASFDEVTGLHRIFAEGLYFGSEAQLLVRRIHGWSADRVAMELNSLPELGTLCMRKPWYV